MVKKSFLLTLCMGLTIACTPNYSKDYEKAKASIDLNASCDEFWKELWPMAKEGNNAARDLLAQLVAIRGLKIPGQPTDANWVYTYLTLVVHKDMLEGTKNETEMKISPLRSDLIKQPYGNLVASCFYEGGTFWENAAGQKCVDTAIEYKIIQPFDEFVRSVDRRLRAGEKVSCANESFRGSN